MFPPDAASTLQAADKSPTCSQEAQTPFTDTVEAKFPPSAGRIYTFFCRLLSDLVLALHNPLCKPIRLNKIVFPGIPF